MSVTIEGRERLAGLRAEARGKHPTVGIQLWNDAKWHHAILKCGATHQVSADGPFAMFMAKRREKFR